MRCLVTGSTGFIGSHLCRALIAQGHSVRAFHRPSSRLTLLDGLDVERVTGDLFDPPSLHAAADGVDWVFHAAAHVAYWRNPEALVETSIVGTRNVVEAARAAGVTRFVLTSSLAAMGIPRVGELLDENSHFALSAHEWPYAYAKRAAEGVVTEAVAAGLDCVILNPSAVLGPGDVNMISGSLVVHPARRWVPVSVPGGLNIVHVRDVAAGHIAAARHGRTGERYIIGGENISHTQILSQVARLAGHRPPLFEIPPALVSALVWALKVVSRFRRLPYDSGLLDLSRHYFYCNNRKAIRELQLPPPVPFATALAETYAWYKEHAYI